MFLSVYNISTHAHSEPFSFLSDGDRTERIKWVHHFLYFIIKKEKKNKFPFLSEQSDLMFFTV